MKLVIVESPTKAKTISRFLGSDFKILSSYGHISDLPKSKMGIDIEHDFKPDYVVPTKSRKIVTELTKAAEKADGTYFATDADREGEAISWHLASILKVPDNKVKRIVFHEITKEAIEEALKNPRKLDLKLVDAQQARRILDRLVGYELSPFLWRKVAKGLSAGRVQSVAVRLIVEREKEILAFKPQEYWTIEAVFSPDAKDKKQTFLAKLHKVNNTVLDKFDIPTQSKAKRFIKELENAAYKIESIQKKATKRHPLPPFTTSTLQQEANHRLGFSAKQTMMLAQQLYEGTELGGEGAVGLITYMRTDSVNLADKFLSESHKLIASAFGKEYVATAPRRFTTKSKLAQEAHEAIRPTEVKRHPDDLKKYLEDDQWRLYDLIWRRAVACQMSEAVLEGTTVDVGTVPRQGQSPYTFRATGSVIKFDGFLRVYGESKEEILPAMEKDEALNLEKLEPKQHFTEPPGRYSDATLVKALEEYDIGRPSTYAPTISTIIERKYVERIEGRKLKPTDVGMVVNDLLVAHFPEIVDYKFTADMEEHFDEIARGETEWVPVIRNFYNPFKQNLEKKYQEINKKEITETPSDEKCDKCGAPMVQKIGRYGKFLACSAFPNCRNIKSLKDENAGTGVKCPKCSMQIAQPSPDGSGNANAPIRIEIGEIVARRTKRGRTFFSCNRYPQCDFALWNKPTGEKCPKCDSLMVEKWKKSICSNKECSTGTNPAATSENKEK